MPAISADDKSLFDIIPGSVATSAWRRATFDNPVKAGDYDIEYVPGYEPGRRHPAAGAAGAEPDAPSRLHPQRIYWQPHQRAPRSTLESL